MSIPFSAEIDESTLDFVTSYDAYSNNNSAPTVVVNNNNVPTTNCNNFNYNSNFNLNTYQGNYRGSSPSSFSSTGSPSSCGPFESADDSGLDRTNMSSCTSYYSASGDTTTQMSCTTNDSTASTVNSFSTLSFNSNRPFFQSLQQQLNGRTYNFNGSSNPSPCVSTPHSETPSPFRSPSGSFSNSPRPINISSPPLSIPQSVSSPSPSTTSSNSFSLSRIEVEGESTLLEFPSTRTIERQNHTTVSRLSSDMMTSLSTARTAMSPCQEQQQLSGKAPPSESCFPPSTGISKDGSVVELKLLSQPSRHHRARYRTEGSRGAVKDRTGRSFPVIKLAGYTGTSPVKLKCLIGHDKLPGQAHLYYQVSKIVGKNITPCTVAKTDGVKVIEMDLLPETGMQLVINCIGIVKERNFDVQRKTCTLKRKSPSIPEGQVVTSHPTIGSSGSPPHSLAKRSTCCNLVFTCNVDGISHPLQVVSEPINCAQILGSPEIHKISHTKDAFTGGSEVFVIGKNFTRESKISWDFNDYPSCIRDSDPEADFINQNHLIFKVPSLKSLVNNEISNDNSSQHSNESPWLASQLLERDSVPVQIRIRCGEKTSDPVSFSFVKNERVSFPENEYNKMSLFPSKRDILNSNGHIFHFS